MAPHLQVTLALKHKTEIIEMLTQGTSFSVISTQFNTSKKTISDIMKSRETEGGKQP